MPEDAPTPSVPRAVVVLWHGRGPNEGHVLHVLAEALRRQGCTVLTPDWDHSAADRGADALRTSLAEAFRLADGADGVPVVIVGWSLGGTAALSLALDTSMRRRPNAIVGLAADTRERSPLDGTVPADRVRLPLDRAPTAIHLVHGRGDTVVPVEAAEVFVAACQAAGVPCSLEVVASDHAGVIGTAYDPSQRICIRSDDASAVNGLSAAVQVTLGAARAG